MSVAFAVNQTDYELYVGKKFSLFFVEVSGEGCFVSSDIVSCNTTLARHFKEGEISNIWLSL